MQLRCNLSSFSVGRGTKKEGEGERGRENGGKESLFVVGCRAGYVDVSDGRGRTDGVEIQERAVQNRGCISANQGGSGKYLPARIFLIK